MIKSLESCSSETALKLSNLEQNLFSMSWDASIIEQKINPIIEKHTECCITKFKKDLSKDCFDILRKSFDIYFKRK